MKKEGKIKISSENMMPIIKKWLYSDKDIFLREIVANGIDAITKFKKLIAMGEAKEDGKEYCIKIDIDKKAKTLTVEDNGLGMTEDEVEKYITQIAFSGASDFLAKYEKAGGDGIIGHFGLGFYSAYMVSENIEIFTKSYRDGAQGVHWISDGNSTYKIGDADIKSRGTKIVMHLAPDEKEFTDEKVIKKLLLKYCSFMPYPIYINPKEGDKELKPVNTTEPLYLKQPADCTEEEYQKFYRETFRDFNPPLFWIHLNMEYPFRLKGILYFPKIKKNIELEPGQVKLYCEQVFVANNIKEVIPEFLMLLNGVIDCPEIPLNVSRSFLQNDAKVQKISRYITKKVADKLTDLFNNDREKYEKCWQDLSTFVKYGCLKDDDFFDKVKDIIIYKNIDGKYQPITRYFGVSITEEEAKKGKEPQVVYYSSDENKQAQYIAMFREAGLDAIICDEYIDPHFISYIEYQNPTSVRFLRIDADVDAALKAEVDGGEDKEIETLFTECLKNKKVHVKSANLKNTNVPAIVNVPEFLRRMTEMNRFYRMGDDMHDVTLIVNTANAAVKALKTAEQKNRQTAVEQIYYLALMSYKSLEPEELQSFTANTALLLEKYLQK